MTKVLLAGSTERGSRLFITLTESPTVLYNLSLSLPQGPVEELVAMLFRPRNILYAFEHDDTELPVLFFGVKFSRCTDSYTALMQWREWTWA